METPENQINVLIEPHEGSWQESLREGLQTGAEPGCQRCQRAATLPYSKILTDMRRRQDASGPHGTVAHREQLLGFPGQLEDRVQTEQKSLQTAFLGGVHVFASACAT